MKSLLAFLFIAAACFGQSFDQNIITIIPTTNSSGTPTAQGQLRLADLHTPWYTVAIQAPGTTMTASYVITVPPSSAAGCVVDDGSGHWSIDPTCTGTANVVTTNTTQSISGQKTFTTTQTFQNVVINGTCSGTGCTAAPAAPDTAVQFRVNSSTFGGSANFTFDSVNNILGLSGTYNSSLGYQINGVTVINSTANALNLLTVTASGAIDGGSLQVAGINVVDSSRNALNLVSVTASGLIEANGTSGDLHACTVAGCASSPGIEVTHAGAIIVFSAGSGAPKLNFQAGGPFGSGEMAAYDSSGNQNFALNWAGVIGINTTGVYQIAGTTVIDAARNILNFVNLTAGSGNFSWNNATNTLGVSGTYNSSLGYQINGVTVINSTANALNLLSVTSSGAISGGSLQVAGINVIDSSRNAVNLISVTASGLIEANGTSGDLHACAVAGCASSTGVEATHAGSIIVFSAGSGAPKLNFQGGGPGGSGEIAAFDASGNQNFALNWAGVIGINTTGVYQIAGTTVIDAGRNLLNIVNLSMSGTCTGCPGLPAGPGGAVQFNNTVLGGSANFTWNNGTNTLGVSGTYNSSLGYQINGTTVINSTGNALNLLSVTSSGAISGAHLQVSGTDVIDASRNAVNLISATVTGIIESNGGNSIHACATAGCASGTGVIVGNAGNIIVFTQGSGTRKLDLEAGGPVGSGEMAAYDSSGNQNFALNWAGVIGINTTGVYNVAGTTVIDASRNVFANTLSAGGGTVVDNGRNGSFVGLTFSNQLTVSGVQIVNSARALVNISTISAAGGAFSVGTLGTAGAPGYVANNTGSNITFENSSGNYVVFGTGTVDTAGALISTFSGVAILASNGSVSALSYTANGSNGVTKTCTTFPTVVGGIITGC